MTQRCTRPTSGSRLRPRVFRLVSKWLDSLYFAVESIHVVLNEVKNPSYDGKPPRVLRRLRITCSWSVAGCQSAGEFDMALVSALARGTLGSSCIIRC